MKDNNLPSSIFDKKVSGQAIPDTKSNETSCEKKDDDIIPVRKNTTGLEEIIASIPGDTIINNYNNDLNIKELTNNEEIVDFYEYLDQCLIKIKNITPASKEEIEAYKVDYILDKIRCKNSFNL